MLRGSVAAIAMRMTASARMAVPQMTVATRQIRRNRGTRSQSSSHDTSAGRTQRRVAGSKTRRPSSNGRETTKVAGRAASRLTYM